MNSADRKQAAEKLERHDIKPWNDITAPSIIKTLYQRLRLDRAELLTLLADAEREIEGLREGIQKYLDGDYLSTRSYKPQTCPHDVGYWQDCTRCDEDYFTELLNKQESEDVD